MDYYEFKERSGCEVTPEEYDRIETVYINHPGIRDVGEMVEFYKANGKMKGIDLLYPVCEIFDKTRKHEEELGRVANGLTRMLEEKEKALMNAEATVGMYRERIPLEDLLKSITREQAERILAEGDE